MILTNASRPLTLIHYKIKQLMDLSEILKIIDNFNRLALGPLLFRPRTDGHQEKLFTNLKCGTNAAA